MQAVRDGRRGECALCFVQNGRALSQMVSGQQLSNTSGHQHSKARTLQVYQKNPKTKTEPFDAHRAGVSATI